MVRFALAIAVLLSSTAAAMAQSDVVEAGAALFQRRCQVCHAIGEGAANKVGPSLNGVVDAPVASVLDYPYSAVLQNACATGRVWTVDELRRFMRSPRKMFPGTKMAFAGQRDPVDLDNLVAYLQSFGPDGIQAAPSR
ncbi:MAG: cytochrome c family protein [Devosia sp.]